MRYAIVDPDNIVVKVLEVSDGDKKSLAANTPNGCTAVETNDPAVTPGGSTYDKTTKKFSAGTVAVQTIKELESILLTNVDEMREMKQMVLLTPGGAKKMIYNSKQDEARAYGQLGTGLVALLNNPVAIQTQFPYMAMECALSGETLPQAMARLKSVTDASLVEVQRIESIAVVAKRRIKAATTKAAKQAAYDAINWNWIKA